MLSYVTWLAEDPDRERFSRLYHANWQRMTRLAVQILGSDARAEDAVHDSFLKLIHHYEELRDRPDERVAAWLMVVVKNAATDMLRREGRETDLESAFWEPSVPADQGEFQALVTIIRQMPEDYRRVLELRFVAEWSLAEIAQAMNLTESAVKTRVFRGRKMLIDQLRKEGYLDGRACV